MNMNKVFLLMFLALPCFAKEPKFHFGDAVEVTKGFYKGCCGEVRVFNQPTSYIVELNCSSVTISEDFDESELKDRTKNSSCRE